MRPALGSADTVSRALGLSRPPDGPVWEGQALVRAGRGLPGSQRPPHVGQDAGPKARAVADRREAESEAARPAQV